jgi:hypothetical protein
VTSAELVEWDDFGAGRLPSFVTTLAANPAADECA